MVWHKNKKFILSLLLAIVVSVGFFSFVHAQTPPDLGIDQVGQALGQPDVDIRLVVARIIRSALGFLGIIAVVIMLYAGFKWMTAGGDEDNIASAKKIMINGVIGLGIILSAYAITSFVMNKLVEATTGVAQDGSGGNGNGGNPYLPGGNQSFFITSLPSGGDVCIRNVKLSVVFNKSVDLGSLQGVLDIQNQNNSVNGSWKYGAQENIAVFEPVGDCAPDTGNDCLLSNTDYVLQFVGNIEDIKSKGGSVLPLIGCLDKNTQLVNEANCTNVNFKTGDGVDRTAPTISITYPDSGSSLMQGDLVPVQVNYVDDNGLQNIILSADNNYVSSENIIGCQKTGMVTLNWPTNLISSGLHLVDVLGADWSGLSDKKSVNVNLRPAHCFDGILNNDEDRVDCEIDGVDSGCGLCDNSVCTDNSQCSSGFCNIPNGESEGLCLDRTQIKSISPESGAIGTYVTISGYYFGNTNGTVYFPKVQNPNKNNAGDWVQAQLVSCGQSFNNWNPSQVLVEVPSSAVSGPIWIKTDKASNVPSNESHFYQDVSNDNWGAVLSNFAVNNVIRPGLCSLEPNRSLPEAKISLIGKAFGLLDSGAGDNVYFGNTKAVVLTNEWGSSLVQATVPNLAPSPVGVKIVNNGVESNSLKFTILGGEDSLDPIITSITPSSGARGEYITIEGRNFGKDKGRVWFKLNNSTVSGSFEFPKDCNNSVWSDTKIVVKFPKDSLNNLGQYIVQVNTAQNRTSNYNPSVNFNLLSGEPSPGFCKIDPVSGPVGSNVRLIGDYFGVNINSLNVYFWANGASSIDNSGRVKASNSNLSKTLDNLGDILTASVSSGSDSGPVVVQRKNDDKISNPINYQVADCTDSGCGTGEHCCGDGTCKIDGDLCANETRSTGYVWRFSTRTIPKTPHIVESCVDNSLPTPSPNVNLWGNDSSRVCRTALSVVEFSQMIDQASIKDNLTVNKCSDKEGLNDCVNPEEVSLSSDSIILKTSSTDTQYLEILPVVNNWQDNTWYQIVLKDGIIASDADHLSLAKDKPCSVDNSSYCFMFKTGEEDCKMSGVLITPYSFWTKVLEPIIQVRSFGSSDYDLIYRGKGISDQRCIMMDDNADWEWSSSENSFSDVISVSGNNTRASAIKNTVGVLSNNSLNIIAKATVEGRSYAETSPLTIDLSDPTVDFYWPNCLETCTDAEIGLRFNTTMSNKNLNNTNSVVSPIKLVECLDENCLNTIPVDFSLSLQKSNTEIIITPDVVNGQENPLKPNTIYKISVSKATDDLDSSELVWSASDLNDLSSYAKPYNNEFVWRFRTKSQSCEVDRVNVEPGQYWARSLNDRKIFKAEAYSSPDACSVDGQKLNSWQSGWNWSSTDTDVATVSEFKTIGRNLNCTNLCVKKGSDIPFDIDVSFPVCGNGILEAGEDCDTPNPDKNCGLNCINLGSKSDLCGNGLLNQEVGYSDTGYGEECDPADENTKTGCSSVCTNVGSPLSTSANDAGGSICGNGMVGSGEDCDWGIEKDVGNPDSAYNCSKKCTHLGSVMSPKWCQTNLSDYGGFKKEDFESACSKALSKCGNGIVEPAEDDVCDEGLNILNPDCDNFCLLKDSPYTGSSLLNDSPSICGDSTRVVEEDPECETNFSTFYNTSDGSDPWALAIGEGGGTASGDPLALRANIKASTEVQTTGVVKSDSGEFAIRCNYQSDQECENSFGSYYAVGADTCCHLKPQLLDFYPKDYPVCLNSYIAASFDGEIDSTTIEGNVLLVQGTTESSCPDGSSPITTIPGLTINNNDIPWYKQLFSKITKFFKFIFGEKVLAFPSTNSSSLISNSISSLLSNYSNSSVRWCGGLDDFTTGYAYNPEEKISELKIKLAKPLSIGTDYAVVLKDGIKDINGVSVGKDDGHDIYWSFKTGSQICEVDKVVVDPQEYYFSTAGAVKNFSALGVSSYNGMVQQISGVYSWDYVWGPPSSEFVSMSPVTGDENSISVTSANRDGEVVITATANIVDNTISAKQGVLAVGSSDVTVFLCENPWPPKNYLDGSDNVVIFPFEDKVGNNDGYGLDNKFNNTALPESTAGGYFNFSTYYCADNGITGTADDLPYLRVAVQGTQNASVPEGILKRFLFTDSKLSNSDAIGITIFPNPKHLSVKDWYSEEKGFIGDMKSLEVDGYSAITDGNNIYVDSLNITDKDSANTRKIYSNIYLFSINSNAKSETRKVFEQIINNLKFNINLVNNYHYCGSNSDAPGSDNSCENDNDCASGQVCSAEKDKLKRNYKRLRSLETIKLNLDKYSNQNSGGYPELLEGTFLSGQAVSTWGSWSVLGNKVGRGMPVDPINRLSSAGSCKNNSGTFCTDDSSCPQDDTCLFHDPITGWSDVDRRFSFACSPKSYAFRYKFPDDVGSSDYKVLAKMERPFDAPNSSIFAGNGDGSWDNFISEFVDNHFVIDNNNGICFQDSELSTMEPGRCGDGMVNLDQGEECDPDGSLKYGACNNGQVSVDECVDCKWTASAPTDCSVLGICGNGVVEAGEECDAGGLNGKSGSGCELNCVRETNTCGDGTKDSEELCDWSIAPGPNGLNYLNGSDTNLVSIQQTYTEKDPIFKLKYSTGKNDSCNWDCKSYGPFCGDGKIETEYKESCEGYESCSINGIPGTRVCYDNCRLKTPAVGWWRFEKTDNIGKDYSSKGNDATCAGTCPVFVDGKFGSGAKFNSNSSELVVPHSSDFDLNELTIEAWIKIPDSIPIGLPYSLIEKDNVKRDFAIYLGTDVQDQLNKIHLKSDLFGWGTVKIPVSYLPGEWHHIVITAGSNYSDTKTNVKYYSDGKLIDSNQVSVSNIGQINADANSNSELEIGRSFRGNGILDEVALYDRVLSAGEIKDRFENYNKGFCETGVDTTNNPVVDGGCGDGVVQQATEACDLGNQNGIACTPTYDQPCTYCSADCRDVVTVSPTAFCGNGIIDEISPGVSETCDFDPNGSTFVQGDIIGSDGVLISTCSADSNTLLNTQFIGDKACTNNCTEISSYCVACGIDENIGVTVGGSLVNVLDVTSANPLGSNGSLSLAFSTAGASTKTVGKWSGTSDSYILQNPTDVGDALIAGDPLCSANTYKMKVNNDSHHIFKFPVATDPAQGQYDLVLSPVIVGKTSNDTDTIMKDMVRIVVKWTGDPSLFQGGFMYPNTDQNGDPSLFSGGNGLVQLHFDKIDKYRTLEEYPKNANSSDVFKGIWWHGPFDKNRTHGESFSIQTTMSTDNKEYMKNSSYAFYISSVSPIERYLNNSNLKVEVYLPDNKDKETKHFDVPDKVFEFKANGTNSDVVRSGNPGAIYWQVFNILSEGVEGNIKDRIEKVIDEGKSLDNGVIFSGANQFLLNVSDCTPSLVGDCGSNDGCGNSYGTCSGDKVCDNSNNSCTCPTGTIECPVGSGICQTDKTSTPCDDGNSCTTGETYQNACGTICSGGTPKDCNDNNACTADSCNSSDGSCSNVSDLNCRSCSQDTECNDNNACTNDDCIGGTCQYSNKTDGTSCADADLCNGNETCQNGSCTSGTAPNCDDNISCTVDKCNPPDGSCSHTPTGPNCILCSANNNTCNDNNDCNGIETCNFTTSLCEAGTPISPDCPSASTVACGVSITPTNSCGSCSGTGTQCQNNQVCDSNTGSCVCPSGTTECVAGSGVCQTDKTNIPCDDGNSCTTGETYQDACGTVCGGGSPVAPICPSASSVACGTVVTPTNGCGNCVGAVGSSCDTGYHCSSGQCIQDCTSTCTLGENRCVASNISETCRDTNGDGCYEWDSSSQSLCFGNGAYCSNGICVNPVCGNGILETGEECDGAVSKTCLDYPGFSGGTLTCTSNCSLTTYNCDPILPSIRSYGISPTIGAQGSNFSIDGSNFGDSQNGSYVNFWCSSFPFAQSKEVTYFTNWSDRFIEGRTPVFRRFLSNSSYMSCEVRVYRKNTNNHINYSISNIYNYVIYTR